MGNGRGTEWNGRTDDEQAIKIIEVKNRPAGFIVIALVHPSEVTLMNTTGIAQEDH